MKPREFEDNFMETFSIPWKWRREAVEFMVSKIEQDLLGIKGIYLAGSTKNATAGPCSDIDIIVHFCGDENQKKMLVTWFKAWSEALNYINFKLTGYFSENGLIDLHIITDEDICNKTSFAVMINSIENSAHKIL